MNERKWQMLTVTALAYALAMTMVCCYQAGKRGAGPQRHEISIEFERAARSSAAEVLGPIGNREE